MVKQRLDQYLVDHNMVESRSMAQSMIMAGEVYINEKKVSIKNLRDRYFTNFQS